GAGRVGDELGDSGGSASLLDLHVEPFLRVEAFLPRDEERRVLPVERPVQTEREFLELGRLGGGAGGQQQTGGRGDDERPGDDGMPHGGPSFGIGGRYIVPTSSRTRCVTCHGISSDSKSSTA